MADETYERVLHAAGPIFAEKGFVAATVREICAAAKVNLASVNYHFGGKETLYLETVRLAHTLRVQQVPPASWSEDATPAAMLRQFIHTTLSRMLGNRELGWQTQLMMREMLQPTIACKPLVEDFIRPQLNQLLEILDRFLPTNVKKHERHQIAFSIVGQCLHYRAAGEFVSLLIPKAERDKHYSIGHLAEHITEFSLAALAQLAQDASPSKTRRQPMKTRKRRRTHSPNS